MSSSANDFQLYDTTLRDGTQQEGMALSVGAKLAIAARLDDFGVTFIEGGWPGAIPKDTEFFRRARTELALRNAHLVAFGATRRPDLAVDKDPQVAALLAAQTNVVTLVAKADSRHVDLALRTTRTENLAMIRDTVRFLVREGRRVFLDAEHFFDGYQNERAYALQVVQVAAEAGAEAVVLCDTNGGTLPQQIGDVVSVTSSIGVRLGIHCHDDTGCAVANTLLAVDAGVTHVQATAHGYGERCGNANLFTVAANLALKENHQILPARSLAQMSAVAQAITELTAAPVPRNAPYVGSVAFTHKAGLHTSAIKVDPSLYQHIEPELVGNTMRNLVSDMAGKAAIAMKAQELGYDISAQPDLVSRVSLRVKELERRGYSFESADASFELVLREEQSGGVLTRPFEVDSWRLTIAPARPGAAVRSEVTLQLLVAGERRTSGGSGANPIEALDAALREGLAESYPDVLEWKLVGSQSWSLDGSLGKPAATRAQVTFENGESRCTTVGVDEDTVAAAWRALQDAMVFILLTRHSVTASF